jgi:hypothetical protein
VWLLLWLILQTPTLIYFFVEKLVLNHGFREVVLGNPGNPHHKQLMSLAWADGLMVRRQGMLSDGMIGATRASPAAALYLRAVKR